MLVVEGSRLVGLDIDHADDFVLGNQRNRQLRSHARRGVDEVLFRRNVVDQHGLAPLYRLSGHALADLDANPLGDLRRMSHLKADAKLLGLLVQQQNRKDLVVDEALQHLRDALQQRVQVQRGVDCVGHLEEVGVEHPGHHRLLHRGRHFAGNSCPS